MEELRVRPKKEDNGNNYNGQIKTKLDLTHIRRDLYQPYLCMRPSRVCMSSSRVCEQDLAEWLERLTNAKVAAVLGSIIASSDTVESEGCR